MIPGSANPLLLATAAAGGYSISRSVRFNSSDSAYLSRTPASAGNRKTWTWAGWVKRAAISNGQFRNIFQATTDDFANNYSGVMFWNDAICYRDYQGSLTAEVISTAVFRDASAWYHFVCAVDTTQATASSRVKLYVNGSQIISFSSSSYPSQNLNTYINSTTVHSLAWSNSTYHFNGYLADIHFIDGQALDPTSFGEFSATTGVWVPKAYTGSYGTNGFKLNFSDNSTTTALGTDTSGNGNTWTVNNLSVIAGAGNDSLVDVPTNGSETDTGVGGEVRGNYCTLNPLDRMTDNPANGNLEWTVASANHRGARATIKLPTSGKWYYEATVGTASGTMAIGLGIATPSATPGYSNTGTWFIVTNSSVTAVIRETSNSTISGMSAPVVGDILQVAYDADNSRVWFGKNNVWVNSTSGTDGNPSSGSNPTVSSLSADQFPCVTAYQATLNANFGQRPFAYTAPSGFKALCTTNLPAPVVTKPSDVFDVKLYTSNGGSLTVSGLGFSPDLVWIKDRATSGANHNIWDTVRGAGKALFSNLTDAEFTENQMTGFTSTGFSFNGAALDSNNATTAHVAWAWDAGSTTVTNTQGSITSSVRANATAGFSIVTYTGTGSNATVGHGLGVAPFMFIVKNRSTSSDWDVYHGSLPSPATNRIVLQSTAAAIGAGGTSAWNSTSPTSTVVSLGSSTSANANGNNHVMYCFAPVAGYSSFGSVSISPVADGAFIYLGFRPKFLMLKGTDNTSNWIMLDSQRDPFNFVDQPLNANLSNAEIVDGATYSFDFVSNGVKVRNQGLNGNFIYCAWAESPFQYARAR